MDFTLIDNQAGLDLMAEKLVGARVIAFDTECASSLHRYINRVCLMQLCAANEAFVVDALAGLDLSPVGLILEDPAIEIVMHDTDFDLLELDREYGWHPKNLFDTLIAARLCGHKKFGLAALLEHYFDIRGSKKFQRADWTIRPIPRGMLEYAASDVIHLVQLRDVLVAEIEGLGRMAWARAKFAQCEGKRFSSDERPLFAKVKGARDICNGRELAVLNELAGVRDSVARELDLPVFKVMGDESLLALVKRPPRTIEEFAARRGMHPACRRRYAGRFVDAVIRGASASPIRWPRPKEKGQRVGYPQDVFDALKTWRADYAAELGVDPDLVLSMDSLRGLAGGKSIDDVLRGEAILAWKGEEIKGCFFCVPEKKCWQLSKKKI